MAGLPPDGEWLVQQNDGIVSVFNQFTMDEVVRFDPSNADESAKAQKVIYDSEQLTAEQKCYAHFWSGYFYANAR